MSKILFHALYFIKAEIEDRFEIALVAPVFKAVFFKKK